MSSNQTADGVTTLGFEDEPRQWSEPPSPSATRDRRPTLLPETFEDALRVARLGQPLPTRKLRMPAARVGVDMTSQLWARSDVSELVTAPAPVRSARMERLTRWLSATITALLVIGLGIALRMAAG